MNYTIDFTDYIHGGTQKDHYAKDEVEQCACPFCESNSSKNIYTERGNIGISRCHNCDLVYTNPRAIGATENYFGNSEIFYEEARLIFSGKQKHHRDKNYEYELKKIKKYKPSGSLLDIGSNMGFFLKKAQDAGFEVKGVEPSKALCKIAKREFNLDVINDYFENAYIDSNSFDIITLIDVFEHVPNPSAVLKKAHHALNKDGILCIKVPNVNYNLLKLRLAKAFGKTSSYDLFNSFEHVVHYNSKSFNKMLDKNGFTVVKRFIPLPIHSPVWAYYVGHYYQYASPFCLDWRRILIRNLFYLIGSIQSKWSTDVPFAPDLMFILRKTST